MKIRKVLNSSVVLVADDEIVKVHVHTNSPDKALGYALQLGELNLPKIENMLEQNRALKAKKKRERKKVGMLAISSGEGFRKLFKEFNADEVLEGGQTMNPSVEDIVEKVNEINADNVFVLPNNKNIILACEQAVKELENCNLIIIPTNNVSQGISAAIAYMPDSEPQFIEEAMKSAAQSVSCIQITHSVRDTEIDGFKLKTGDIIALEDGVIAKGNDVNKVAMEALSLKDKDELKVNLAICFTPDEEIGLGASKFDVKKMNANIAYTIDGGPINYANYENFNAASAKIIIHGINVHPGSAKDIMINASLLAIELNNLLPSEMIPSKTEEYEGFIHLEEINGDVNKASLSYILRDHDLELLQNKKELILKAVDTIKNKYPKAQIEYEIKDSYLNMAPEIIHHPEALLTINNAYLKSNETISYFPIRGGTDGATITYMGLPCPNLGTGGYNAHGKFELVSLTQMNKMIEILKNMLN